MRSKVDSPSTRSMRNKSSSAKENQNSPKPSRSKTRAQIITSENCPEPALNSSPRRGGRSRAASNKENTSTTTQGKNESTPRKDPKVKVTPSKRKIISNDDSSVNVDSTDMSPAKILKSNNNIIEANNKVSMSPTVRLSRLSINSPKVNGASEKQSERSPLRTVNDQVGGKSKLAVTKRRSLFSPQKGLDDCEITDMLFDTKTDSKTTPKVVEKVVKIDVVTKDDGVFKKPVGVVKTPVKLNLSPRQELISPGKRLNHDKIEDMLFSPEKPVAKCSPPKMTKVAGAGILSSRWSGRRESPLKINNSDDLEALLCSPIKDPSPGDLYQPF